MTAWNYFNDEQPDGIPNSLLMNDGAFNGP